MVGLLGIEDELGPKRVIHVYEPSLSLNGILVVDNVAAGPSIGGLRMATDVTLSECFRLARAMTLKNAAAGLPHGGGKSVLRADPTSPRAEKEALIRAFAGALRDVEDYIFGPDMGTDEQCMAWVKDEIGRSVGLRLIPTERDLRYAWYELPQERLDEQAEKMRDSVRQALMRWAIDCGEASDYRDNRLFYGQSICA